MTDPIADALDVLLALRPALEPLDAPTLRALAQLLEGLADATDADVSGAAN